MKEIIKKKLKLFTAFIFITISIIFTNNFVFGNNLIIEKGMSINKHSDTSIAVFDNRRSLVLDASKPLTASYTANTSKLNFISKADGQNYFDGITDNLLSYIYNFDSSTVIINIHIYYKPTPWNIADWNNYIKAKLNP